MATTTTMETNLPSYTDYTSLLQIFKVNMARHKDSIFVRYQLPGTAGFKALTYRQVDDITSYLASIWESTIPADTECIALLSDDPAQSILAFFTVLKLGRTFFPLSTYRSEATVIHLLQKSNAGYLIASKAYREKASKCAAALHNVPKFEIQIWVDFDIEQLIIASTAKAATSHYKNNDDGRQSKDEHVRYRRNINNPNVPVTWLQSSGTTSEFPKAVLHTTRSILYVVLEVFVKSIQETCPDLAIESTDVILVTEKLFHAPALITLVKAMLYGASIVMFTSEIPTPRQILDTAVLYDATVIDMVPAFLEELAQYLKQHVPDDQKLTVLERFKYCICTGAPLSRPIGEFLRAKGLNVVNGYGMTEAGCLCLSDVSKDNEYWYSINVTKSMMRHVSLEPFTQDMYQFVVHSDCPSLPSGISNRPNGDYATKDLFIKEAHGSGYWTFVGRTDDLLIMSSGEKVHPTTMEMEICKQDVIQHCIVIGENKAWTAVLIELNADKASQCSPAQTTSKVYEAVHKANKCAPPHGIILVPKMVYILPFDKILPKTPKGTVNRKAVATAFAEEIEQMYESLSFNTYLDVAVNYYETYLS